MTKNDTLNADDGSTLSERILNAVEGSYVDKTPDRIYAHDGTGIQALNAFKNFDIPQKHVINPQTVSIIYDHIAPANNSVTANLQRDLRKFSQENSFTFHDVGSGICHQIMSEGRCLPNEIVIGADSHTCTLGALGAFAAGVGATDMAGLWAFGSIWLKVPESKAVVLSGKLSGSAEYKDVALSYVKALGNDGATYKALEFIGESAGSVPMDARLTLTNMAVETGAKTGLFYSDKITREYLIKNGVDSGLIEPQSVGNCDYESETYIDLDNIEPMITLPHRVDNAVPVADCAETPIDQVFIGTCTNGRYADLKTVADILKGKKIAVRTIVAPASKEVFAKASEDGIIGELIKSGCTICPPGCAACLGAHMGVLAEGEVGLSTANRNYKNRMGVGAEYYLSSPSTAAASALTGMITSSDSILGVKDD